MAASDSEEDEDEETLQLKLQAIEARLKLKKLQASKAKSAGKPPDSSNPSTSRREGRLRSPEPSKADVQVPFSPVRKRQPTPEQKSPARVILGIDKGLRAQDISLKRAANARDNTSRFTSSRNKPEPAAPAPKVKSFSERIAESRVSQREQQERDERIQQSRSRGFGLAEAGDIFNRSRTDSQQTDSSKASSRDDVRFTHSKRTEDNSSRAKEGFLRTESRQTDSSRTSSREDMLPPSSRRPDDAPSRLSRASEKEPSSFRNTARPREDTKHTDADSSDITNSSTQPPNPPSDPPEATSKFESFSGLHLTKRTTDHTKLTRALHGKEVYTLPRLLKEVKSPNYDPPDCEMDYVVIGIICYKTTPHDHKNNPKAINSADKDGASKPKFMVLRLTDLKWEIDLFLFDTGFDQFWKLTEGTVIAVLNPGIMPPRVRESGAFSLKVTSCEDTIIEIGTAQDMGFCNSIKADGKQCTQWIDNRKTEVCEFHLSLQIDKARKGRMQFNTMTGFGKGNLASGGKGRGRGRGGDDSLKKEGKYHDRYLHETMYLAPKEYGLSAATLLDDKSAAQKAGMDAKEASRKRRRDLEKEAELAKQLGMKGNGAGSEYLTHQSRKFLSKNNKELGAPRPMLASSANVLSGGTDERPDAKALGLLSNTAQTVSLSPVKGRKRGFNTSSAKSHEAMGWSGAFKRGVLERSLSPEMEKGQTKLSLKQREASPRKSSMKTILPRSSASDDEVTAQESPRKKARLLLPFKGVRIPGRESFGGATPGDIFLSDDDDD
jgi:minichromosome maintenance protein 10